jgi:hypothetical protein
MSLFFQSVYLSSALSLLYIFLLYRSHPLRRLPVAPTILVFAVGSLSVIPVVVLRWLLPGGAIESGVASRVLAAAVEEGVKFAALWATAWRFRFPNLIEPFDLAIYFGILGVGFGVYEDFWYIFSASYPSWVAGELVRFNEVFRGVVLARALPGHILFNALAGFLLGHGWVHGRRRGTIGWVAAGVGLAVLLHAGFNLIAESWGTIPLLTYLIVLVGCFLELRRRALAASPLAILIDYVEGKRRDWPFARSPSDYLFAEGFGWPGRRTRGLFQFYPVVLSLTILFPLLFVIVYLINRGLYAAIGSS